MTQPREYTVKEWKPWENEEGLIRDPHGNYKGTVIFEEDTSEPIDATFKTQPSVGDKKYGTVDFYTTRAGKTRKGFKSAPKPQEGQATFIGKVASGIESPERQKAINRSVALNDAAILHQGKGTAVAAVLETAEALYQWLEQDSPKAEAPSITQSVEEAQAQRQAERDQAEFNQRIKDTVYEPGEDPINLNDIPF